MGQTAHKKLARILADSYAAISNVTAVALGGSTASGTTSTSSDIDLYVFTTDSIPLKPRKNIVEERGAIIADLDLSYWDLGDQWIDLPTGIEIDVMYWDVVWIKNQINQILVHHRASLGYSTCHWYSIKNAYLLFDRQEWFANMQTFCDQAYPSELQEAIITKNFPVLRNAIPSYLNQIIKALDRQDWVSINHRVAALLASYFDILYAVNKGPHPGEKRLIEQAILLCPKKPTGMVSQINRLLYSMKESSEEVITSINDLIDGIEYLLQENQIRYI